LIARFFAFGFAMDRAQGCGSVRGWSNQPSPSFPTAHPVFPKTGLGAIARRRGVGDGGVPGS
jgi:hypothetical protein